MVWYDKRRVYVETLCSVGLIFAILKSIFYLILLCSYLCGFIMFHYYNFTVTFFTILSQVPAIFLYFWLKWNFLYELVHSGLHWNSCIQIHFSWISAGPLIQTKLRYAFIWFRVGTLFSHKRFRWHEWSSRNSVKRICMHKFHRSPL